MSLRFRLKGLAETFVESLVCPCCGNQGKDEELFSTEMTRVTFDGIVVVAQCRTCKEIFVPSAQRMGVMSPTNLRVAVEKDLAVTGEVTLKDLSGIQLAVQKMNAERKGQLY